MVTLKDVALRAGVSSATVSRVVRGTDDIKVGAKCRAHVQQVIKEMGYRPNINARALASNRTEMLGIITPDLASPFFGALASGAELEASQSNYKVLMCNSRNKLQDEMDAIDSLREHGCQNIVMHSKYTDDSRLIKLADEIPGLVIMNRFIPGIANRCVWIDNIVGSRILADYVISQGHTQVACVSIEHKFNDPTDRILGVKQALSNVGLELPDNNVHANDAGIKGGEAAVKHLLNMGSQFTAVFAYNDFMAIGVINGLKQAGLRVPEDVSVVGFDDILVGEICQPNLTTMRYPISQMAKFATKLSLQMTNPEEKLDNKTHLFMPELIVRDSVANIE